MQGTHSEHHCGHVQNVRAGQAAEHGPPILGDLHFTDADLADNVLKRRSANCGQRYHLAYDGERISQVGITGNHVDAML
jgi:hypothetical protein